MKSNNKVYIVLLVILFVFFIVMFLLFGVENIKQESYSSTIIVGNSSVFQYKKEKWMNIRMRSSLDELSWNTFKVYQDRQKLGEYELWYSDNRWYAFDQDRNAVKTEENIFAYDGNYDLKITYPEEQQVSDLEYVNQLLLENNISTTEELTSLYKINIDIDNDTIEEDFYIASNVFTVGYTPEKTFSFAFMVKDNMIYPIYQDIRENNFYDACKPYFNVFLDVNNDQKYEFILSCGKYSNQVQMDVLYQFVENQFKILISNQ